MAKKKKKQNMKKQSISKKKKQDKDKQFRLIVGWMIGIVIFLVLLSLMGVGSSKFTYKGINFEKSKYGDITLYTATIPVYNDYGERLESTFDLRLDPRTLKDIEVNVEEKILLLPKRGLWVTISPDTESCEDAGIGIINLAGVFLKDAGFQTKLASIDKDHAEREDINYITCEDSGFNSVLVILPGNKTEIQQVSTNCYELRYSNCEVQRVTEAFELAFLEQHMSLL